MMRRRTKAGGPENWLLACERAGGWLWVAGSQGQIDMTRASSGGPLAHQPMGHVPALDGLRAIAILLVFMVHLYATGFSGGNSGVDLFFVLSGFLITKLAYEESARTGSFSLREFYLRRVFRILPALLVLLAVMLVASYTILSEDGPTLRLEVLFSGISAGNLWPLFEGFRPRGALGHTWSLGIEEQFYIFWPAILALVPICMLAPRRFIRWILGVTLLSIVIGRVLVIGVIDYPHWGAIPLLNFDGLALGCLVGIFVHTDTSGWGTRLPTWPVWIVGLLTLADWTLARTYFEHDPFFVRNLVLRLGFAYAILVVVSQPEWIGSRWLGSRRIVWLGLLSYSLYLWHLPVMYTFSSERYPEASRLTLVPLRIGLSFALAAFSFFLIERPALRYGRSFRARFRARRSTAVAGPVQATDLTR